MTLSTATEMVGKITPVSERVRRRLQAAGQRYFANDNISEFINEGELQELQAEVADRLGEVMQALVIDVEHDHNSKDTAQRVARMFVKEVFAGRYQAAPPVTAFPNASQLDELMVIGPLEVRSACSHHLVPIMGKAWIGVLPDSHSPLIGLSKYARLANWIMSRPQIQEEAISDLADLLEEKMNPRGIAVVMEADHLCMQWRGVKDGGAKMVNSVMRGEFLSDRSLRSEFLSLINKS